MSINVDQIYGQILTLIESGGRDGQDWQEAYDATWSLILTLKENDSIFPSAFTSSAEAIRVLEGFMALISPQLD